MDPFFPVWKSYKLRLVHDTHLARDHQRTNDHANENRNSIILGKLDSPNLDALLRKDLFPQETCERRGEADDYGSYQLIARECRFGDLRETESAIVAAQRECVHRSVEDTIRNRVISAPVL